MTTRHRFIKPERMGAWTVVALGVGLVALVLSTYTLRHLKVAVAVQQVQVMKLEARVRALESTKAVAPAPALKPAAQ
jgi:hypothetical protein